MSVLIQSAFDTAIASGFPTLMLVVENEAPADNQTLYAMTHFLPAPTVAAALGANAMNKHTGIFQVTVKGERGAGWGLVTAQADQIRQAFKRGDILTSDGHTITVNRSYRGPGYYDNGKYCVPVSIDYTAYLPKDH